jgi:hypothetical protein
LAYFAAVFASGRADHNLYASTGDGVRPVIQFQDIATSMFFTIVANIGYASVTYPSVEIRGVRLVIHFQDIVTSANFAAVTTYNSASGNSYSTVSRGVRPIIHFQDIATSPLFANGYSYGDAAVYNASYSRGVRLDF